MVVEPATDEALVSSNVNGKKVEQKLIPLHSTPERIPDANESIDTDDEHTTNCNVRTDIDASSDDFTTRRSVRPLVSPKVRNILQKQEY